MNFFISLSIGTLFSKAVLAQSPTAEYIVARADANLRGTSSYSEMTMNTTEGVELLLLALTMRQPNF